MFFSEALFILGLALLVWFWFESSAIRESARRVGARLCREHQVQFLDDTVHLSAYRLGKTSRGQWRFIRTYQFEFTNNEQFRYQGEMAFAGKSLLYTHMDAYRINEGDSQDGHLH